METSEFIEILEAAGYKPFSYSGRYMFGKQCVAIPLDNMGGLFKLLLTIGRLSEEQDHNKLSNLRTDELGRGLVIYWPYIEWVE